MSMTRNKPELSQSVRDVLSDWQQGLEAMRACGEALEWSRQHKSLATAWARCERADWMLWLATKVLPRERVVLAACACARTVLGWVPAGEKRPRIAIETAERWAHGEATLDEVLSAAYAAAIAYPAATYAAARDAAIFAAYAAAYADAAYAAAAAYVADGVGGHRRRIADVVRRNIPASVIVDAFRAVPGLRDK